MKGAHLSSYAVEASTGPYLVGHQLGDRGPNLLLVMGDSDYANKRKKKRARHSHDGLRRQEDRLKRWEREKEELRRGRYLLGHMRLVYKYPW